MTLVDHPTMKRFLNNSGLKLTRNAYLRYFFSKLEREDGFFIDGEVRVTQDTIAEEMGCSKGTVQNIEKELDSEWLNRKYGRDSSNPFRLFRILTLSEQKKAELRHDVNVFG